MTALLDFLARTDLDGRYGGPALIWTILSGVSFLIGVYVFVLLIAVVAGHSPFRGGRDD